MEGFCKKKNLKDCQKIPSEKNNLNKNRFHFNFFIHEFPDSQKNLFKMLQVSR